MLGNGKVTVLMISVAPEKQWAGNLLATVVEPVAYVRTFSVNLANVFNPSRAHYI